MKKILSKKPSNFVVAGIISTLLAVTAIVIPVSFINGQSLPGPVQNPFAIVTVNTVDLTWKAPSDLGGAAAVNQYIISVTDKKGGVYYAGNQPKIGLSLKSVPSGDYTASIIAETVFGQSSPATVQFTVGGGLPIPGIPQNFSYDSVIIATENTISLSWDAIAKGGVVPDHYTLVVTNATTGKKDTYTPINGGSTSYELLDQDDGDYTVSLFAYNADNVSVGTAASVTLTLDQANPGTDPVAISDIVITLDPANNESATVTWTTNVPATSAVTYGPGKLFITGKIVDATEVTNHTVQLTKLFPCTIYEYEIQSSTDAGINNDSNQGVFLTDGCAKSAEISHYSYKEIVFANLTDSVILQNSKKLGDITVKQPVLSNENAVVMQMKQLGITAPDAKDFEATDRKLATNEIFELKAFTAIETQVDDFEQPVEITLNFVPSEIDPEVDINTLAIWHSEDLGITWDQLGNCDVVIDSDQDTGEITCSTSSFSLFAIFGEPQQTEGTETGSTSSGRSSSGSILIGKTAVATTNTLAELFLYDLRLGMTGPDVLRLQILLNKLGYQLASNGAGAAGMETSYFGPRTIEAVKKLQAAHRSEILVPAGADTPTGFFGPFTRAFINEMLKTQKTI